jgi:hypothetical protein
MSGALVGLGFRGVFMGITFRVGVVRPVKCVGQVADAPVNVLFDGGLADSQVFGGFLLGQALDAAQPQNLALLGGHAIEDPGEAL